MAKYRLKLAHYLDTLDNQQVWLPGDKENDNLRGAENGTVVGDGTPYRVKWPTLEMEPLDDEAKAMLEKEHDRLFKNQATMNPVDALPIGADDYEERYIPGMEGVQRREPLPDGAPVAASRQQSNARPRDPATGRLLPMSTPR
jgi:hypothetical protein